MDYLLHVFYGIIMAYFGLISPGMLNMTALRTRLQIGKSQSVNFALGAASIVFVQAAIALFFADYFVKNPNVVDNLKMFGVLVFFILSVVFFLQSRKRVSAIKKSSKGNYFLKGMGMSSINMLAIPFYLGVSIVLASEDKVILEFPYILFFVFGASVGSFLLFYTYISFAKIIINRISFIAKNINILLSVLFFSLGIFTLIKLFT